MSTREELLGAEVLQLVDHFRHEPHEHHRRHHPLRAAALTALEALALVSLAHRLESRTRRFASVAYLKHRVDDRHPRHH
jgi:hypothetical protein